MKKTTGLGSIILIIPMLLLIFSCADENIATNTTPYGISGEWTFLVKYANVDFDSTGSKHNDLCTYEHYETEIEKIYLHQDGDKVTGNVGLFQISGNIDEDEMTLNVYEHPNGVVELSRPTSEMIHFLTIKSHLDNEHNFDGTGFYVNDPDNADLLDDTISVMAYKTSDFDENTKAKVSLQFGKGDICDAVSGVLSFAMGTLANNLIRPMGNCFLQKEGGGYYVFGQVGPGSLIPIWTQTIYYPLEGTPCAPRKYKFNIKLQDKIFGLSELEDIIKYKMPNVSNNLKYLGVADADALIGMVNDFYAKYGGFAISFGYSTRTHNISLYVNVDYGDSKVVYNEPIVQNISKMLNLGFGGEVDIFVGKDIKDSWNLYKTAVPGICNSSVIFCYLIGTHNVKYE